MNTHTSMSTADLVALARKGDKGAIAELHRERDGKFVRSTSMARLARKELAGEKDVRKELDLRAKVATGKASKADMKVLDGIKAAKKAALAQKIAEKKASKGAKGKKGAVDLSPVLNAVAPNRRKALAALLTAFVS